MVATTGVVPALQGALAAENAAIFGYGAAGAHLTGSSLAAAEQDWTGHHEARDALAAMISRRGATPAAAQAFYQLPFRVHDAASARALAAHLEEGVTSAYLGLVAVSDQGLRRFGALAMQAAARRAAFWRGSTEAFPGLNLLARSVRRAANQCELSHYGEGRPVPGRSCWRPGPRRRRRRCAPPTTTRTTTSHPYRNRRRHSPRAPARPG
jgi:hypothetical protein